MHEANPSSRVAQAATARTEREAKDLEPDLVLSFAHSAHSVHMKLAQQMRRRRPVAGQ